MFGAELWLGQIDGLFWTIFCPFNPLGVLKFKFFKKLKNTYSSLDNQVILGQLLPFTPLRHLKIKFFKKQDMPRDIIILHYTKNYDHMLYSCRVMLWER